MQSLKDRIRLDHRQDDMIDAFGINRRRKELLFNEVSRYTKAGSKVSESVENILNHDGLMINEKICGVLLIGQKTAMNKIGNIEVLIRGLTKGE